MNKGILKWNFVFQYGYVITNIINSLILLPFYLHKIDASTLGVWLATGNILAWMTLIDPGVGDVLQQKIAELRGRNESEEIGKTIGSGLLSAGVILLLSVVAGFVFYFLIGSIINKDVTRYPNLQIALFLSIIATGMSLVSFAVSGINQGMQNAAPVAISSITANILFLIVNILLLVFGFGVIAIAFANLCRAFYINLFNFSALKLLLKKEQIAISFKYDHFKRFIRIFSFTSLASIIGGFSASMDTIVLARFIAPWMITVFEINKRPVQLTQSMIGRHSVALMPVISHAAGSGNKSLIIELINKHFKLYTYAAWLVVLLFCFEYNDLITVWTGKGKFAGYTILYLLVANFFVWLVGYFMANMGYAVGDIKMNSLVNILKGLGIGILYYVFGRMYGIVGVLSVALAGNFLVEFSYFTYRLYQLGYLENSFIKTTLLRWLAVMPVVTAISWAAGLGIDHFVSSNHIIRITLTTAITCPVFLAVILLVDAEMRATATSVVGWIANMKILKKRQITTNTAEPVVSNNIINNELTIQ